MNFSSALSEEACWAMNNLMVDQPSPITSQEYYSCWFL